MRRWRIVLEVHLICLEMQLISDKGHIQMQLHLDHSWVEHYDVNSGFLNVHSTHPTGQFTCSDSWNKQVSKYQYSGFFFVWFCFVLAGSLLFLQLRNLVLVDYINWLQFNETFDDSYKVMAKNNTRRGDVVRLGRF